MASIINRPLYSPSAQHLTSKGPNVHASARRYVTGVVGGWDGNGSPAACASFSRGNADIFTVYISGDFRQKFELQASYNPVFLDSGHLNEVATVTQNGWVRIGVGEITEPGVPLKQTVRDVAPFFRVLNISNPTPTSFTVRVWYLH